MDINRVSVFVKVVNAGGFTAAAAEMQLPKSSVSRSVAQLEADLGVRLLQRTTRQVTLTEAGQMYFDSVSASITALVAADAAAREHGIEPRGTVRVTAPPDLGGLSPALVQFARKHPRVRIELSITSRVVDLVGEGFDLAVRAGTLESSSLVARRIGGSDMAVMASPAYLRRRGRPKTVDALGEHDWVLYRANDGRASLVLKGPGGPRTVDVTASIVADDLSFCRQCVEHGAGLGLLPVHSVADRLRDGALEQVLPGWSSGGGSLYIVLPTSRYVPARVALVRDFLADYLRKQLAAAEPCIAKARATAVHRASLRDEPHDQDVAGQPVRSAG